MNERLVQLIDYLNVSVREFERKIEVTEGVISKSLSRKTGLKADTIQKIAEKYPQITLEWLLLGNGEMLRSQRDEQHCDSNSDGLVKEIELLRSTIRDKEEIIDALRENQQLLREKIELLEVQLAHCEAMDDAAVAS